MVSTGWLIGIEPVSAGLLIGLNIALDGIGTSEIDIEESDTEGVAMGIKGSVGVGVVTGVAYVDGWLGVSGLISNELGWISVDNDSTLD